MPLEIKSNRFRNLRKYGSMAFAALLFSIGTFWPSSAAGTDAEQSATAGTKTVRPSFVPDLAAEAKAGKVAASKSSQIPPTKPVAKMPADQASPAALGHEDAATNAENKTASTSPEAKRKAKQQVVPSSTKIETNNPFGEERKKSVKLTHADARPLDDGAPPESFEAVSPFIGHKLLRELRNHSERRVEERDQLVAARQQVEEVRAKLAEETTQLEVLLARLRKERENPPQCTNKPPERDPDQIAAERLKVAKTLRGMNAQEAAQLLSGIDANLAADLMLKMRAVDAGKALAAMKPKHAAMLATLMAGGAK